MSVAAGSGRRFGPAPAAGADLAADRAFCRAMLPRVSRTFAINIRLLGGSFGDSVRTAYLLCRAADTLEDSWPGAPASLARRFDLLLAGVEGDRAAAEELARDAARQADGDAERPGAAGSATPRASGDRGRAGGAEIELLARLPAVLRVYESLEAGDRAPIAEALRAMAQGMRRFAVRAAERGAARPGIVAYLDDGEEISEYCYVVAGCVGVMLTRLFGRRDPGSDAVERERLALAPVVGEALQITNIYLDWPSDLARGRCHVPARWIAEAGLSPELLDDARRPGVRALAERLESRARAALARVPDYLELVPVRHWRYRLFCLWPALWARASLDHARRDPEFPGGTRRPKLSKDALWRIALGGTLIAHDAREVRRRLAG